MTIFWPSRVASVRQTHRGLRLIAGVHRSSAGTVRVGLVLGVLGGADVRWAFAAADGLVAGPVPVRLASAIPA